MTHRCKRCGGKWESDIEKPVSCRWCRSSLWDREKKNRAGSGRPRGAKNKKYDSVVGVEAAKNSTPEDSGKRVTRISGALGDGRVLIPIDET